MSLNTIVAACMVTGLTMTAAGAAFIWPTVYSYETVQDSHGSRTIRTNRFTDEQSELKDDGDWHAYHEAKGGWTRTTITRQESQEEEKPREKSPPAPTVTVMAPAAPTSVPEPASLLLLGLGATALLSRRSAR